MQKVLPIYDDRVNSSISKNDCGHTKLEGEMTIPIGFGSMVSNIEELTVKSYTHLFIRFKFK